MLILFAATVSIVACDNSSEEASVSLSPTPTDAPVSRSPSPAPTASPTPSSSPAISPSPLPTPSPSPTTRPNPTPLSSDFERFKQFAVEIAEAARVGDAGFFAERAVIATTTCPGNEEFGPCAYREEGEVVSGVPSAALGSDAFGYRPLDEFETRLEDWFSAALAGELDDLGGGSAALHAVAWRVESPRAYAVLTEILDRGPVSSSEGPIGRQIRVFYFDLLDGDWALKGELTSTLAAIALGWAHGDCPECYDVWEFWESGE